MATLQDVLIGLGFDIDASGLDDVDSAVNRAAHSAQRLGDHLRTAIGWLSGIATGALAGFVIQQNAEFEDLSANLETVTGSAEAAKVAFKMIEDFASTTPFNLNKVVEAFTKLKAQGLDTSQEALTSYGNTASAMGQDIVKMIDAVGDASRGQFDRLNEFGIIGSTAGNQVSLTFRGVTKTMKRDSKLIQRYLMDIGLKEFAGAMDRRAKTLSGVWSNVADNAGMLARKVGQSGLNDALRDALKDLIGLEVGSNDAAASLGQRLGTVVREVTAYIKRLAQGAREALAAVGGLAGVKRLAIGASAIAASVGVAQLVNWLKVAVPAAKAFVTSMTLAGAAPLLIGASIVAIGLMVQDFYTWLNGGESQLSGWFDFWYNFPNPIGEAMLFVWEEVMKLPDAMQGGVSGMLGWLYGFVRTSAELAWQFAGGFLGAVGSMATGVGAAVVASFNAIGSWIERIRAAALGMVQSIVGAVAHLPETIANALGDLSHLVDVARRLGGDLTAGVVPGPRPALAGAGGGYSNFQNSTSVSVNVPSGTTNPAAIGRAVAGAAGDSTSSALAQAARTHSRPQR